MKITSHLTELWRHKLGIFLDFSHNSSLICFTTLIIMKFSQEAYFLNKKYLKNLREVTNTNDQVMKSSKLRCGIENWWRHISVKNDGIFSKLCGIYCYVLMMCFVKFHWFSSIRSCFMKIAFLSKQQKTPNTDDVVDVSIRKSTHITILKIVLYKCQYPNLTNCKV